MRDWKFGAQENSYFKIYSSNGNVNNRTLDNTLNIELNTNKKRNVRMLSIESRRDVKLHNTWNSKTYPKMIPTQTILGFVL